MLSILYIYSPQQIHFRSSGIRSQKLGIHALHLSYTHMHTRIHAHMYMHTHTHTHFLLHYLTPWILLSTLIGLDFTIILDNITLRFWKNFVQARNVIVHFKNFPKKISSSVKHQQFYTVPRFFEFLVSKILALLFPLEGDQNMLPQNCHCGIRRAVSS